MTGWWLTYPSEKKSLGMMTFPTEWKNNPNVPNHQPVIYVPQNILKFIEIDWNIEISHYDALWLYKNVHSAWVCCALQFQTPSEIVFCCILRWFWWSKMVQTAALIGHLEHIWEGYYSHFSSKKQRPDIIKPYCWLHLRPENLYVRLIPSSSLAKHHRTNVDG